MNRHLWHKIQESSKQFQLIPSKKINISLFVIGIVIVAGGTSLPELASSISAVTSGHANLALGAIVGSNIANLILIMAATTLLIPIYDISQNQINQGFVNIILAMIFGAIFQL